MINVLFTSHSSELNGAERMLLDTLRLLDRRRFRPLLLAPRPGALTRGTDKMGIETLILPMKWTLTEKSKILKQPFSWTWNILAVHKTARLIKKKDVSLVVSNSAACWTGALAARRAGVPHVWFIHEILDGEAPLLHFLPGRKALVRRILRLSRRIVVNSRMSARAFGGSDKVAIIGNGVEAAPSSRPDPAALKSALGLNGEAKILGVIGKIYPGKRQKTAVLTLDLLRRTFPGIKLLLVGGIGDRRYFADVMETARTLGLESDVHFLGYREDLTAIYGLLDVLIVPSVVDSLGRIALEAMASGTPVVAAARGGLPEIALDGETGVLVDPPDADGLAAGAARVLQDPAFTRKIIAGGMRLVAESYSLDGQVRKIEKILEESLAR